LAATIADVARIANVSTATVSRVMNGYPFISGDVRERVEAAIRQSGYRPNIHARRLNNKDLNTICFILSNYGLLDAGQAAVFMGVSAFCANHGFQTMFLMLNYEQQGEFDDSDLREALQRSSDIRGLVLGGRNYPNLLRLLDAMQLRHVLLGNSLTGDPVAQTGTVWYDDTSAAREAVGHLVKLGHKDIRFIGDVSAQMTRRRHEGYRQGMEAARLTPAEPIRYQVKTTHNNGQREDSSLLFGSAGYVTDIMESAKRSVSWLLSHDDLPTGIVCGNDIIAHSVVTEFTKAGLRVPDDVSVVGFGDLDVAVFTDPPLTTYRIPWLRMGATAARMLLPSNHPERLEDMTVVLPVALIERESTGKASRRRRRPSQDNAVKVFDPASLRQSMSPDAASNM
jgi:LacI family transcriptional regulator, repressor for deo operon, udp, cdd, tsx, nupC, and nupG